MTPDKYKLWKDFATRAARTWYKGHRRPSRKQIVEMVEDFFAIHDDMDEMAVVVDWDHSTEYPPGNRYHGREGHQSYCGCNGYRHANGDKPNPECEECHGRGVHYALIRGDYICDLVSQRAESWVPGYWKCPEHLYEAREDRWMGPASCCIRAGLDLAVAPSAGVVGFTAGDIREMYPDGVPDWIKAFFSGPAEIVALHETNVAGVFNREAKPIDATSFDLIPDGQGVWL